MNAFLKKECGGSSICQHGREDSKCKECGGSGICEHEQRRNECKEWHIRNRIVNVLCLMRILICKVKWLPSVRQKSDPIHRWFGNEIVNNTNLNVLCSHQVPLTVTSYGMCDISLCIFADTLLQAYPPCDKPSTLRRVYNCSSTSNTSLCYTRFESNESNHASRVTAPLHEILLSVTHFSHVNVNEMAAG